MSVILKLLALGFGVLFALSFAGALLPLGDSLAVFRVLLAVLFALCLIWTGWPRRLRWPGAVLAMAAIAQIALPRWFVTDPPAPDLILYQQNLLYTRSDDAAWLAEIARQAPDIITLQEVSGRNLALLQALRADYPTQALCPFATVGGVAVLSRFAATEADSVCAQGQGFAAIQLQTPHGPLWAGSIHLHWPWPYGQAAQVDRLVPVLAGLTGNTLIGGDFNAVGWSHSLRSVAGTVGGKRVPHAGPSFTLPHIAMPVTIDHVVSNFGQASAVTRPQHGSDHFGILAKVTFHAD